MNKRVLSIALVVILVCTVFCGCTKTVTTTTTETNSDGTTTTTTVTTTNENGNVTTSETTETKRLKDSSDIVKGEDTKAAPKAGSSIIAPVEIINNTDFDFYALYIGSSDEDSWSDFLGDDILCVGESVMAGFPLGDNSGNYDFRIVDSDGAYVDFYDMYLGNCANGGTATFSLNDDGSYNMSIEKA